MSFSCLPAPLPSCPAYFSPAVPSTPPPERSRVVIVGAGFAGLPCARRLARHDEFDVTVIDRNPYQVFSPLLYQVATGIISEGEIAPLTRVVLRNNKNCQVLLDERGLGTPGIELLAKIAIAR